MNSLDTVGKLPYAMREPYWLPYAMREPYWLPHAMGQLYWLPETTTHLYCYSVPSVTDVGTGKSQGGATPSSQLPCNGVVRHPNPHEGSARV